MARIFPITSSIQPHATGPSSAVRQERKKRHPDWGLGCGHMFCGGTIQPTKQLNQTNREPALVTAKPHALPTGMSSHVAIF